jgi:colanic acid/amylovoran biosynthesis glycosyltransferase
MRESDRAMKIGYICGRFPTLTETFVYNEVLKLRERHLDIEVFSIHRPTSDSLSSETCALAQDTFYVLPLRVIRFAIAHLYLFLVRPFRYLYVILTFVIAKNISDIRKMRRTFLHFLEAVYIADGSRKKGISHHHAHFATGPASVAMFVSILNGTTFSFTVHAMDLFRDKLLLKEKARLASFIISISQYNKHTFLRECPDADPEKIRIVRCGVDLRKFQPRRLRRGEEICLLSVGRLVEKKGFAYLIHACRVLKERGHKFNCVAVGDDPDRTLLEQLIKELDLEEDVRLVGGIPHSSVRDYYEKADIFVLPCVIAQDNDQDGIPVVLIEAMAMGLPCVSTRISGIPELIEHRVSGLLVESRNVTELANAIEELIKNEDLRKELGSNGRIKVIQEFSIEDSSEQLAKIFSSFRLIARERVTRT